MYYVSEQAVIDLVDQETITNAVADAFVSLAADTAICWPVVREDLGYANAIFGFKSGFDRKLPAMGVKAGGLWPGNARMGIANHQSTVLLFDEDSGAPKALIRATYLTALRTAAASALAIRHLARADVRVLGIIGAGGQSEHQLRASLKERAFEHVLISDRNAGNAERLRQYVIASGYQAQIVDPEELCQKSDAIITVTPSRSPIVESAWVRPGTHISAMGADTRGKQELGTALVAASELFVDVVEQACALGELQHASTAGLLNDNEIVTLGRVINGAHPGRSGADAVTIFDSTGMALQDLCAATAALNIAIEAGRATWLD